MALTHHDDIELMIGDEWVIRGRLLDEDGQPIDLGPANVDVVWALCGPDGYRVPGLEVTTVEKQTGGDVLITLPHTLTRTLEPARYLDSIRVVVDGAPSTEWVGIILANADPFHLIAPPLLETPPLLESQMEEPPDDGQLYARRAGQWIELPSGFSTMFEYIYEDTQTAPPNNSQLRLDNSDPTLATKIWLHNNNADSVDVSNLLLLIEQGFIIFVQDKNDPTHRARFLATGPMINLGTYCEIPVMFEAMVSGGVPPSDGQRVIVMVYGGG